MRSLLSLLAGWRDRGAPSAAAAPQVRAPLPSTASAAEIREAILVDGLDAERAIRLGVALEHEGRALDAIDAFTIANRLCRSVAVERHLIALRHAAFAALDHSLPAPSWPPFVPADLPGAGRDPEVAAEQFSPGALRNGILRHGCLLVRGLLPVRRAERLRESVERAFDAYEATCAGSVGSDVAAWYAPFAGLPNGETARAFSRDSGGVLAADSPRAFFEFLETLRETRIDVAIASYLGERPTISVEKTVLRKTDPKVYLSNWHQDGAFLGKGIRTVDAWFPLTPCGVDAPGMDLIPIRFDRLLPTGGNSAAFDWTVAHETIRAEVPDVRVWSPEMAPGDVLFLDHMCLHRTGAYPQMTKLRYAIESWFFASSVYPSTSTPIVV